MFSELLDTVYPFVGYFFGLMSGIANAPFHSGVSLLCLRDVEIACVNLFTGSEFVIHGLTSGFSWIAPVLKVFKFVLTPLWGVLEGLGALFNVWNAPFWVGFLIVGLFVTVVFGIARWLISLVLKAF